MKTFIKFMLILIVAILLCSCDPNYLNEVEDATIVYYTPNGKSYHSTRDCPSLARSSTILSAELDIVAGTPREDPCDNCVKQD
jgi:hypothetical protein